MPLPAGGPDPPLELRDDALTIRGEHPEQFAGDLARRQAVETGVAECLDSALRPAEHDLLATPVPVNAGTRTGPIEAE